MSLELPEFPLSPEDRSRGLHGRRAGEPGEGFADVHIVGQRLARLSQRLAKELGYEDNPEQLLLCCPQCGLMNDFTIDGRQVYYFSSEFRGDRSPQRSTTPYRIQIVALRNDAVECQCGKCGAAFVQRT